MFLRTREDEPPRAAASPPKSQRSLHVRREPSLGAADAVGAAQHVEVAALRRQLGELQLHNQQLTSTVRAQQATIKQLQVCCGTLLVAAWHCAACLQMGTEAALGSAEVKLGSGYGVHAVPIIHFLPC